MEKPSPLGKRPILEITNEITGDFFDKKKAANVILQEDTPLATATTEFPDSRKKTRRPMPILRHHLKLKSNGTTGNGISRPVVATPKPWEMTPLQYGKMKAVEKTGHSMLLDQRDMDFHEVTVKGAIEDKKTVPREVLAHYP